MRISKARVNILKRLTKRIVVQGPDHETNIIQYFNIMVEASNTEFSEDNRPTQDAFLRECFEAALTKSHHKPITLAKARSIALASILKPREKQEMKFAKWYGDEEKYENF